jgi:hypothetical protein
VEEGYAAQTFPLCVHYIHFRQRTGQLFRLLWRIDPLLSGDYLNGSKMHAHNSRTTVLRSVNPIHQVIPRLYSHP